MQQTISDNLARVRERIANAASAAGRSADEIQLVAVTKYVGISETAAILQAGCADLGESRPQQLWKKAEVSELAEANWHLIGHLQRNKADKTVPLASLIHSVESERLLSTINKKSENLGQVCSVLLEINCSGEAEKHGLSLEEASKLIERIGEWKSVCVKGLMTMARRTGGPSAAQKDFASLRTIRDQLQAVCPKGIELKELSMGMSGDFEAAIQEGSTIVRVGSALFEGIERT